MNLFLNRNKIEFVFIDWFGVLSTNYYWCVQSKNNKLLKEWCDGVFKDPEILNDWMRGKLSIEYLADIKVKIQTQKLIESFLEDMAYYEPDHILLAAIDKLFPKAKKMLVTDNFPLFDHIVEQYTIIRTYFSKLYLSHEIGKLKNDLPDSLFDHISNDLGLMSFHNCVLIDDNENNCINFRAKGGRTILIS